MIVFLSDLAVWFKMYPHPFEAIYVCCHAWSDFYLSDEEYVHAVAHNSG